MSRYLYLPQDATSYKIYDANGKLVKVGVLSSETSQISTKELHNAIYIISISYGKNILYQKFIKE